MSDITLHSMALSRDMVVRVVSPSKDPSTALPVVYLLHGAGENYRTWTNNSNISGLAARNVLLVMPDSADSYYINDTSGRRYEDYFISELMPEIRRRYPNAATDRTHTAIVGVSRGGFGAVVLALKHPALFSYVGGFSSAFNLAERDFRWRAPLESLGYRQIFGPAHGKIRRENDPYILVHTIEQQEAPYFYLSCGNKDVLLEVNRNFASILRQRKLQYSFNLLSGGHNWSAWTQQIPGLESSLLEHFGKPTSSTPARTVP